MMMSLFSSFDPANSYFHMNYSVTLTCLLITSPSIYLMNNRKMSVMNSLEKFLTSEIISTSENPFMHSKNKMMMSLFMLILIMNIMGLFPYIFTLTAHMALTLSLALPIWMTFLMFNFMKTTNHFLAHLVPLSTPMALSQFMTLIESVSQLIRPITLSVRLTANMTAGHILMALASAPIFMMNLFTFPLMVLILLEIAVAFIQSYVFVILLTMYMSETSH